MKLKALTINNFKSIKTPQTINFDGNLITLLGKNGSGKTNVLQSIFTFFQKRNYGFQLRGDYTAELELSDEEVDLYSKNIEVTKDKKILANCNGEIPDVVQIESQFLSSSIIKFKSKLEKIREEIRKEGVAYIEALSGFEYHGEEYKDLALEAYCIETNHSKTWWLGEEKIKYIDVQLKEIIKKYDDYINVVFVDDKINLFDHSIDYRLTNIPQLEIRELEAQKICISPVLAKCLKLSVEQIDKANRELAIKVEEANKLLKIHMLQINNGCEEFAKVAEQINAIYQADDMANYNKQEMQDNAIESIVKNIKNEISKKCYYLDNEASLLFSNTKNNDREQQREYFQNTNPILMAIHKYLIVGGGYLENESILEYSKIDAKRIDIIVDDINKNFLPLLEPKFDKETYKRIKFEYKDKALNLVIEEKSGDVISFNETSLGRRWYYTYSFIKALLADGDYLIIDEPASFLHPSAQVEFLDELEKLSAKGIKIIYSTHSPYMIGEKCKLIKIDYVQSTSLLEIRENKLKDFSQEIGIVNFNDMLLGLSKTYILVEGKRDICCIATMMEQVGVSSNNFSLLQMKGAYNIDKLIEFFDNNQVDYKILLDADTKEWANNDYEDKKRIGMFVDSYKEDNMFFAGENKTKKRIEGLFSKEDAEKHFEDTACGRKTKMKIKQSVEQFGLTEETEQNFKDLFTRMDILK